MGKFHDAFEEYLETHSLRLTTQKTAIVDALLKVKGHFEIEDFIDSFRKSHKLSRATVYRTVKQLLDAGLIQKILTKDGKVFYEKSVDKKVHDHLICNVCGKILEMKNSPIETHIQDYCDTISFVPEYRSLHIYGVCKKCSS